MSVVKSCPERPRACATKVLRCLYSHTHTHTHTHAPPPPVPKDQTFDKIVFELERIMTGMEFDDLQEAYLTEHCGKFADLEENTLEHMDIFQKYCALIEAFLEAQLAEVGGAGCSMAAFSGMLEGREGAMSGEIFDMLLSMSDFGEFKKLMVAHKELQAHGFGEVDLIASGITVDSIPQP